jgi:hypothetical protein
VGARRLITEERRKAALPVVAKYLYEAFDARDYAATSVLANRRRSGGDARTLAR